MPVLICGDKAEAINRCVKLFCRHTTIQDFLSTKSTYLLILGLLFCSAAWSQRNPMQQIGGRVSGLKGAFGGEGTDSLKRRDKNEDSITIYFRYLDSTRNYKLDSSVSDITRRFPMPATNVYLGNTGSPARSILFAPMLTAGWDPGFHVLDTYKWNLATTRFFNTTRPYSELNYMLASRSEQLIELLHTQNVKPNWNVSGQYRLIAAPGSFNSQKTSHSSYRLTSWYQSVKKRYNNYFAIVANKLQASENGGIMDTTNFLEQPNYDDRFTIPTKIGGASDFSGNFFSTNIKTGNRYTDFNLLLRQQYDFGKKDSLVTDSTVIPLFYPRLRFEHTFQLSNQSYHFQDTNSDTAYYRKFYDILLAGQGDTLNVRDTWREILNDFSIYQFPDAKNLQQFIKIGASVQNLTGRFRNGSSSLYNIFGHAEYRNRTRNQKWDIEANGQLYFAGFNAGDFHVYGSLQSLLSKKIGYLKLGFENANRTPSFIYNPRSSFHYGPVNAGINFKKENNSQLFASFTQPALRLQVSGRYYLSTNYTYVDSFYRLNQHDGLFNVLQITAQKNFKFGKRKRLNLYTDVYFQQVVGDAPVNVPLVFTRVRFAYEGNLGFKNLDMALGIEGRYHTSYKAAGYSPMLGQFQYQDTATIRYKLPDLAAYVHFRIRSFKAFVRAENLNTMQFSNGFGFTNNNLAATGYPYPGFIFRLGIYWSFVN